MMFRTSRKRQRGQVLIEFAFTALFSVPLILGLIALGMRFVRELSVTQISRDLANMYARDDSNAFRADNVNPNLNNIVQRLAPGFDFSSTGTGVAIISKVRKITGADCDAAGVARGSCNTDQAVFEQRIVLGNPAVRVSNFGTPNNLDTQGNTSYNDQLKNQQEQAVGFLSVLPLNGTQNIIGADGVTPLTLHYEEAYMVEVIVNTGDLNIPGFMPSTQAYARNIF